MFIVERYYDVGKSHYKNGLASQMVSHYLANVLLLLHQFILVYFMLCSSCKGIENILSTFSKKRL